MISQQANRAIGHLRGGEVVPLKFPEIVAAELYSSIRDMSRYVQIHLNRGVVNGNRILDEELLEQGLFVHYDGEIIDLRSHPSTYANQEIRKK